MTTDWLLRVADGTNFINSSKYRIWGIQTITSTHCKHFVENVRPGDRLWFIQSGTCGKVIAVATYRSHNDRELGPLIDVSLNNEQLGWTGYDKCNVEIHYTDLYWLSSCELLTHIKGHSTIRKYNENCKVNLAVEYSYITRYSRATFDM